MSRHDPVRLLLGTYLFADLTPAALRPLADHLVFAHHARGEYVVRAGEQSVAIYVVISGLLREVVPTPAGEELMLELYGPGDVLGEVGLFSRDRTRIVSIIAMKASEIASLQREILIEFLLRHPPAMLRMLQSLAEYIRAETHDMANIAFRRIRERLAVQLLELCGGSPEARPTFSVSQTNLAAMIGATRENVNRALGALAADGILTISERSVTVIDRPELKRLAASAAPLLPRPNRPLTEPHAER
jgi:CRP/FNR family transcriptional regulator, cyclic AMP receptor protein